MDITVVIVNSFFLKKEMHFINYPKITPQELPFQALLTFSIKDGQKVAKYFGYREPVSNDYFIIDGYYFTNNVQYRRVYQVQINNKGELFLQGNMDEIKFEKIRTK